MLYSASVCCDLSRKRTLWLVRLGNKFSEGCCLEGIACFRKKEPEDDVGFSQTGQTGTRHSEALFLPVGNLKTSIRARSDAVERSYALVMNSIV